MRSRLILQLFTILVTLTTGSALFFRHYENPEVLRPFDYMQYWSAGRALINGQNPYDGATLFQYQKQIGTNYDDPIMMWNPPWTLPIATILGSMHWRSGQILWFIVTLVSVAVASAWTWKILRGNPQTQVLAIFGCLGFAPTIFTLLLGQISGLLLLGIAGFVYFHNRGKPVLSGIFLTLIAIKPHLFLPVAAIVIVEFFRDRQTRIAAIVSLICLGVLSSIPLLWNPEIWQQYVESTSSTSATGNHTISQWVHPTIGYLIRDLLPGQPFHAMFIPAMVLVPVAMIVWKSRQAWSWTSEIHWLLLMSLIAAPYGAWAFDLVILVIPVLVMSTRIIATGNQGVIRISAMLYITLNVVTVLTVFLPESMTNYWFTLVILAAYIAVLTFCANNRTLSSIHMQKALPV